MPLELCPWKFLSEERLREFLSDQTNNEGALDRKIVIDYLKEHFDKPRFLDVGCGTGFMYLALKKSGMNFEYLGVDKTENMVGFAQRRFPEANFTVGDIYKLPFPDRSWDVVYVRHVLTHLPGYEEALGEVARVTDNSLIICFLYPLADKQQIKVVGKPPDQTKPNEFSEHYLNTYAREPFMETLKSLGFNVVMDKIVQVGGYFGKFELIIARRNHSNSEEGNRDGAQGLRRSHNQEAVEEDEKKAVGLQTAGLGDRGRHEELERLVEMTDYWKDPKSVAEFEAYWNRGNRDSLVRRWGLVERLAKNQPYPSILDVGAGIGNLIAFTSLATEGNYLGIDISPSMVERARILHPKFRFEVVDPMKFATLYDLVVAHGFLLHQHDPFVKLRKLTELTKSHLIFDVLVTNEGYSRRSPKGYWTRVLGDEEYVSVKGELAGEFSLEEVKFGEWGANREYYLSCRRR